MESWNLMDKGKLLKQKPCKLDIIIDTLKNKFQKIRIKKANENIDFNHIRFYWVSFKGSEGEGPLSLV